MHTRSSSPSPGAGARKRPRWIEELRTFAYGQLGEPFVWGRTDCHALATRALDVMTGQDYCARIRDRYQGLRSALRVIAEIDEFDDQLEAEGGYQTLKPEFGDFVIYSRLDGVKWWRHRVPALCLGGGRVILPVHSAEAIGLAPLYAIGRIHRVLRVPCLKQ